VQEVLTYFLQVRAGHQLAGSVAGDLSPCILSPDVERWTKEKQHPGGGRA
jgi:hypothetical protein